MVETFQGERLVLFHSPCLDELGVNLEHGQDGYVRITKRKNEDGSFGGTLGLVEGQYESGNIVCEVASVNLRHSISEHMFKLCLALMKVTPRPIEVVVKDEETQDIQQQRSQAYNVAGDDVVISASSPKETHDQAEQEAEVDEEHPEITCNPFDDPQRFGEERKIVFHTESLGIKLHRSPHEGIVHVLHVAPYQPLPDSKPPREGDYGGHLEQGDTILEVGGVDLRNKVIGQAEWADMVFFVKHVGRPLDMVVAKDKLFTRERAGVTLDGIVTQVQKQVEQVQEETDHPWRHGKTKKKPDDSWLRWNDDKESRNDETPVEPEPSAVDAEEDVEDVGEGCKDEKENEEPMCNPSKATESVLEQVCVPTDSLCGGAVVTSPRTDASWIKKPEAENKNNDKSWIKPTTATSNDEKPPVRAPTGFYSRTHPKTASPQVDVSPSPAAVAAAEKAAALIVDSRPSVSVVPNESGRVTMTVADSTALKTSPVSKSSEGDEDAEEDRPTLNAVIESDEKKSVAELREMISPIDKRSASPRRTEIARLRGLKMSSPSRSRSPSPSTSNENEANSPKNIFAYNSDGEQDNSKAGPPMRAKDENVQKLFSPMAKPQSPVERSTEDSAATLNEEPKLDEMVEKLALSPTSSVASVDELLELAQDAVRRNRSPRGDPPALPCSPGENDKVPTPVGFTPLGPTPRKPTDQTQESPFHADFLRDLKDEFGTPPSTPHGHGSFENRSESRDDDDASNIPSVAQQELHSINIANPNRTKHVLVDSPGASEGSTISVGGDANKKDAAFGGTPFDAAGPESPFVGNVRFETPTKRVPASALFSQAFVVQSEGADQQQRDEAAEGPTLHVVKKDGPADRPQSYLQLESPRMQPDPADDGDVPEPDVKGFGLFKAFDFGSLEDFPCGGQDGSFDGPNESFDFGGLNDTTVVYEDGAAPIVCCGVDPFCGAADASMFEGLVSNCADTDAFRMSKERANGASSPRKGGRASSPRGMKLLGKLRRKKKNKEKAAAAEYGALDNDGGSGESGTAAAANKASRQERPRGIRNARVAALTQNIRGYGSMATASQFSRLQEDERISDFAEF